MSMFPSSTKLDATDLMADLAEKLRPFEERLANIEREYLAWSHREQARPGSDIVTEPPTAVTAAIQRVQRERAETALKFFHSAEAAIRMEFERCVNEIRPLYEALAEKMDALTTLERHVASFASRCGVFAAPSVTDPQISGANFQAWSAHTQRVLHPPTPAPRATMVANPLPPVFD
jgi:hypothetical protein